MPDRRRTIFQTVIANQEAPNLLDALNPGFETLGAGGADVFANWVEELVGTGIISDETTLVHNGGHALKVSAGDAPDWRPRAYQNIDVLENTDYILTFWTRGDGFTTGNYTIYDLSHSSNIFYGSTGVAGTSYTKVTKSFTTPAGCTQIQITLQSTWGAVNSESYYDDVVLLRA